MIVGTTFQPNCSDKDIISSLLNFNSTEERPKCAVVLNKPLDKMNSHSLCCPPRTNIGLGEARESYLGSTLTGETFMPIPEDFNLAEITKMDVLGSDLGDEFTSLINDVCPSELNTPEVDVFKDFDFPAHTTQGTDFSQSNASVYLCTMTNVNHKVESSPASPAFYSDQFENKTQNLTNSSISDIVGNNTEFDTLNDEIKKPESSLDVTDLVGFMINDNFSKGGKHIANHEINLPPYGQAENRNFLTTVPEFNQILNRDFLPTMPETNQNLYQVMPLQQLEPFTSISHSDAYSHVFEEEMSAETPLLLSQDPLLPTAIRREDLPHVPHRPNNHGEFKIDLLDSLLAKDNGNILEQAMQESCQEESMTPQEIEKANAFLNYSSDEDTMPTGQQIPTSNRGNQLDTESILKSFKNSHGNEEKVRVVSNVKVFCTKPNVGCQPTRSVGKKGKIPNPLYGNKHISDVGIQITLNNELFECNKAGPHADSATVIACPSTTYSEHPHSITSGRGKRNVKPPPRYVKTEESYFSDEEDNPATYHSTPSRKRGRFSLDGLSDAEKYQRIRAQNNLASKKCREKKKQEMRQLAVDVTQNEKTNQRSKIELRILEERKRKWIKLFNSIGLNIPNLNMA